MLTVRTSENTVITSFRLISERQDFSSVRTGENTVRARARIQFNKQGEKIFLTPDSSNPVFKPLFPSEGQEWEVIGVVTYSIKKL